MTEFKAISTGSTSLAEPVGTKIETANSLSTHSGIERSARVGFNPEQLLSTPTYIEAGVEKLTALADAVGLKDKLPQIIEVFRAMTASWGERKVGEKSSWQSGLSDDYAPFEFSIALDPQNTELRILVEAQGIDPNLQSNWQAGMVLNQHLAEHFNISLDRFQQIEDLFVPTNPEAKFSMWHAACFYPDKEPAFKLYLNPQSQQKSRAAAVIEESLVRLGFPNTWSGLAQIAAQRGPEKDEFAYFSLDLSAHAQARVKVYLRHYNITTDDLERALSLAENYVSGDATEFCQALIQKQGTFSSKPIGSCFSFVEGNNSRPSNVTLYVPIGYYTTSDRVVADRLEEYFNQHDIPNSTYNKSLQSFAARSLDAGCGMYSHISLRRDNQQRRVTIYLNPEVNIVRPPVAQPRPSSEATIWNWTIGTEQPAQFLPSLENMVWHYEDHQLIHHPFFQRLQREPVNPQPIWLLFMNLREGSYQFTRRLANIISRINDERIRCILAKQLNDELGNGDINGIHTKLFEQMMTAMEHWRMDSFIEEMLMPGHKFSKKLEEIYLDPNPYVGVGSAMVLEVYGKQFDQWLGRELQRTNVDLSSITWVTVHESLEIDHANESLVIARFASDSEEGVAAARQGIEKACIASWSFLNDLYLLCYSES
jgi:DMATS type aromatic prenyltransferase